jgi:hypothetical protein
MSRSLPASFTMPIAVLTIFVCAAPAGGQEVTPPYRGLFNSSSSDRSKSPQALSASWSIEAASDRDLLTSEQAGVEQQRSRNYSDGVGELRYTQTSHAFSLTATAGAVLRYDQATGNGALLKDAFNVSIGTAPARRTSLQLSASRVDAPYTLLPVDGPTSVESAQLLSSATDQLLTDRRFGTESLSGRLTQRLARHTSVSGDYDLRVSTLFNGLPDFMSQRGTLRLEQQIGRSLFVNGGYSQQLGTYDRHTAATLDSREADAGLDYRPKAGRTRVSFGAGSATVADDGRERRRATGYARIDRTIGRAWVVRGEYRRGIDMAAGFLHPLVADAATLTLGGYLGRRVDVVGFGGLWLANTATSGVPGYRSHRAGARGRVALSRAFAVYGEYLWYDYRFDPLSDVPISLANNLMRRGVRFGVMSSLPRIP